MNLKALAAVSDDIQVPFIFGTTCESVVHNKYALRIPALAICVAQDGTRWCAVALAWILLRSGLFVGALWLFARIPLRVLTYLCGRRLSMEGQGLCLGASFPDS